MICTSCSSGFVISADGSVCSAPVCNVGYFFNEGVCKCPPRYFEISHSCQKCNDNC